MLIVLRKFHRSAQPSIMSVFEDLKPVLTTVWMSLFDFGQEDHRIWRPRTPFCEPATSS